MRGEMDKNESPSPPERNETRVIEMHVSERRRMPVACERDIQ